MTRHLSGLSDCARISDFKVPDGMCLVRAEGVQYRWHASKPFYMLRLSILEPSSFSGQTLVGRLDCASKALWKLGWFLRDFLYDPDLLSADQVDERALQGLVGVVKVNHTVVNGISLANFEGFAPASQWEKVRAIPVESAVDPDGQQVL